MSRRLDISSLLCDEPPDEHPHLPQHSRTQPVLFSPSSSSSSSSRGPSQVPQSRSRANTVHYEQLHHQPSPLVAQPKQQPQAFLGLDALVHAATEERRRLSVSEHSQPQPQQLHHHQPQQFSQLHQQPQTRQSPQFHRSPWQEDLPYPPRQPQSPLHTKSIDELSIHSPRDAFKTPTSPYHQSRHHVYDDEQRLIHMRQYQLQQQERERMHRIHTQEIERQRMQHDPDRIRAQEEERLAEIERKANMERQRMEEERLKLEAERMRLLEVERRIQEQEARRRDEKRREVERFRQEEERKETERREREIAAIREAERREQQRRDRELEHQRRQEEQRYQEIQRRLQQHHQQQQQQHHQQQQQRQYALQQEQQHLQRTYEHPARIEIPPGPQLTSARKSDPIPIVKPPQSPIMQTFNPSPRMADQRPVKKRRYSESPSLGPMLIDDSHDRIQRDREKMTVGEIGYGRYDSPMAVSSSSSLPSHPAPISSPPAQPTQPRRPLSGTGVRKPVSVTDLLVSDHDGTRPAIPSPTTASTSPRMVIIPTREAVPPSTGMPSSYPPHHPSGHHRILSPLGRRSPPGSQAGRAKAARKSDDHSLAPHSQSTALALLAPATTTNNPVIAVPEAHRLPLVQSPRSPRPSNVLVSPASSRQPVSPAVRDELHQPKRQKAANDSPAAPMTVDSSVLPLAPAQNPPATSAKDKESKEGSHQRPLKQAAPVPVVSDREVERQKDKEVSRGKKEEDAHDWLLEHYAEASPPLRKSRDPDLLKSSSSTSTRPPRPRTRSPSTLPSGCQQSNSPVIPIPSNRQPTPPLAIEPQDDEYDDGGLEQELEKLLAEGPSNQAESDAMDVDVDSAVAELVAETLEDNGSKTRQDKSDTRRYRLDIGKEDELDQMMSVAGSPAVVPDIGHDVEDELLSLVEDTVPVSGSTGAIKRHPDGGPLLSVSQSAKAQGKALRKPGKSTKVLPLPLRTSDVTLDTSASPSLSSATSSTSPASTSLSRPSVSRPSLSSSQRDSMPPPTSAPTKAKEEPAGNGKPKPKTAAQETDLSMGTSSKKKTPASKKLKGVASGPATAEDEAQTSIAPPQAKPRGKLSAKKKVANDIEMNTPASTPSTLTTKKAPKAAVGSSHNKASSVSRSRSASAIPNALTDEATNATDGKLAGGDEAEFAEAQSEDDKLYCVCKTKYDQERFMIACDRCDEWYHMQCVDMPERLADLVDQFFCPPCIERNPELHLRTTYKQRCLWGLKHSNPDSPAACHKPAHGAFSKYCSEECGVKYMQTRIDSYAKKGGKKDKLWDGVKHADKREGVVVKLEETNCNGTEVSTGKLEKAAKGDSPHSTSLAALLKPAKPVKSKANRECDRLKLVLADITKMQDEVRKGIEIISWRERLLALATDRSETVSQCGWDQRLCFGDEEWADDFGQNILESYESFDRMDVDENQRTSSAEETKWWCLDDSACARHVGWQVTRYKDISKEKEKREEALSKLEAREQEVRRQLGEMFNPVAPGQKRPIGSKTSAASANAVKGQGPFALSNSRLPNGHSKHKAVSSDTAKKGKKRKAP
ncbi:hypothetical protein FA15DRAFT_662439 [Coprinopsis marcescibilis]|uniref:PHD-type domain-containing protein n=1 Tax=Coprinopsis marcescibilis TaxID=230819 RepID=A0A5C3LP28_COPMA|nr:hypothetical protein FA15DRAFT_662439 [Coprinopsis marcescibilis]